MTLIYIFLFVILVFVFMSYLSLRKLNQQNNANNNFSDDRYYELKYKLQYISSVGVIIIAVAGFFGLDKYENFVKEFKTKTDSLDIRLKDYDKKISLLDSNFVQYESKLSGYDNFFKKMDLSRMKFSKEMIASNIGLSALTDTISNIKKRNVLDKSFYVIDNLHIDNHYKNNERVEINKKFYFKDMSTIIGDQLPVFNKKPVIFVIPQSSADISLFEVTNEYVIVDYASYQSDGTKDGPKSFAFGLLIARKSE